MEDKVTELLDRQSKLSARHGRLDTVLDRAAAELPDQAPAPAAKPDLRAAVSAFAPVETADAASAPFSLWQTRKDPLPDESAADHADKLFVAINQSLRSIESEQMTRVTTLAANAYDTADKIADALEAAGLPVDSEYGKQDVGGPLIAVDGAAAFDTKVKELDEALDQLDALKKEARCLPDRQSGAGTADIERLRRPQGSAARHAGAAFGDRLPRAARRQRACHGAGRRGQGGMERRLRPHGRGRPRQRLFDALRASEPHRRARSAITSCAAASSAKSAAAAVRPARICTMKCAATATRSIRWPSSRPA